MELWGDGLRLRQLGTGQQHHHLLPPPYTCHVPANPPSASHLTGTAALPSEVLSGRSVLAISGVTIPLLPVLCVAVGLQACAQR